MNFTNDILRYVVHPMMQPPYIRYSEGFGTTYLSLSLIRAWVVSKRSGVLHEVFLSWRPNFAWIGVSYTPIDAGERKVYVCVLPCVCVEWVTYAPKVKGLKVGDVVRLWPGMERRLGFSSKGLSLGEIQEFAGTGENERVKLWFAREDALVLVSLRQIMSREKSVMEQAGFDVGRESDGDVS